MLEIKLVPGGVCGGKIESWRACWEGFWWSEGPKCQVYGILGVLRVKCCQNHGFINGFKGFKGPQGAAIQGGPTLLLVARGGLQGGGNQTTRPVDLWTR